MQMTPVGFEPTQLALVELESTPLDHSGKVSLLVSSISIAQCRMLAKVYPAFDYEYIVL